ncbi:MAG TPA: CBS domain-containing protein [Actinomycetota bacterium]|nr:CBS domain-containing protein [Actinomycetota bacterium]
MSDIGFRAAIDDLLGTVDEVALRSVVSLSPHQPIGEAARELEEHGVSGAPVIEGGRIVGVVSLKDLFAAVGVPLSIAATSGPWHRYEHHLDSTGLSVRDVMTRNVVTLPAGTPLAEAAAVMRERGVNRIPIIDGEGAVVAILARDDIVGAVAGVIQRVHRAPRSRGVQTPD